MSTSQISAVPQVGDVLPAYPQVAIRDLGRNEGAVLDDLMIRLSPRSRYLRFHVAVGKLNAATRRALLDVDDRDHVALVAEVQGRAVGIARFIRMQGIPSAADISIAVADEHHRSGIGRQLLQALRDRALAAGIQRLEADLLPWNVAALRLARAVFPYLLTRREDGGIHLVCSIGDDPGLEVTMDDVLADLLS
jgi:GNAT superfamily N-acetyltransferase